MPTLRMIGVLLACLYGRSVGAQAQPRTLGPEEIRLRMYVGTWTYREQNFVTPVSDSSTATGTHTYELLPGGFFVVHRWDERSSHGVAETGIEIFGYDREKQVYRNHSYTSLGQMQEGSWQWTGDTLRFSSDTIHYHGNTGIENCAGAFTSKTKTIECRASIDGRGSFLTYRGVWTRTEPKRGRSNTSPVDD
jgi:hypothetical protein